MSNEQMANVGDNVELFHVHKKHMGKPNLGKLPEYITVMVKLSDFKTQQHRALQYREDTRTLALRNDARTKAFEKINDAQMDVISELKQKIYELQKSDSNIGILKDRIDKLHNVIDHHKQTTTALLEEKKVASDEITEAKGYRVKLEAMFKELEQENTRLLEALKDAEANRVVNFVGGKLTVNCMK